jgi:hypothetical protein
MNAFGLLQELEDRGVFLSSRDGKLIADAPAGALTPADRDSLASLRLEMLGLLQGRLNPIDLPPDWRIAWEERAAIMEYEGGLPRERAEVLALTDVLNQMRRAGVLPLTILANSRSIDYDQVHGQAAPEFER